jgi:hypothetical protein
MNRRDFLHGVAATSIGVARAVEKR